MDKIILVTQFKVISERELAVYSRKNVKDIAFFSILFNRYVLIVETKSPFQTKFMFELNHY